MLFPRLVFLDESNPANPLIARQRRKPFPNGERRAIGSERSSQIYGQFVYGTV